jgi:signal transduction histidine kinase
LTPSEGTGIGLIITKQLVDAMGVSIEVETELGSGSVFYLEFDFLEMNSKVLVESH